MGVSMRMWGILVENRRLVVVQEHRKRMKESTNIKTSGVCLG